jgi:hypothetical protein
MRFIWLVGALHVGMSAHAAAPPDASGQFHDWFRSLTVPGSPNAPCCSVADCRMVESRWNSQTQHYEARVARDVFSNALEKSPLYEKDLVAFQTAKQIWLSKWLAFFGDVPEAWIEIPEARINRTNNPTGRAVLCWSIFYPHFNGVFCFIPFQAASLDLVDRAGLSG